VRIEGDAEVAQRFRELLAVARPDVEEELALVLGDVAAHRIGRFARGVLQWGRAATDSLATNVVEFLQEEGRDLPTRVETEEFLAGVDRLRDDAERFEARLARLERRSSGASGDA
jgi:ubiquinone biosynthesis protein UbiJ